MFVEYEGFDDMTDATQMKAKLIFLGDGAVGKTCLIKRYVLDQFSDEYVHTLGAKVMKKNINIVVAPGNVVKFTMVIWDIMGQWQHYRNRILAFNSYRPQQKFYLGARGAMLVCDLTRRDTLENVDLWVKSIVDEVGPLPFVLVANKSDLAGVNQYGPQEVALFAQKHGAPFFLTSAKTGQNVQQAFLKLAELVYRSPPAP